MLAVRVVVFCITLATRKDRISVVVHILKATESSFTCLFSIFVHKIVKNKLVVHHTIHYQLYGYYLATSPLFLIADAIARELTGTHSCLLPVMLSI